MSNLPGHRPSLPYLTSNSGAGPSSSSQHGVGSSIYSRPLTMRPAGIMRQRLRQPEPEEVVLPALPTDSRIDNLVTNFVVANGLPFDVVRSESFKSLLRGLNPRIVLPTPKVIENCSEKLGNPGKPLINYQKTTGPLSVTLHITNTNNKHYLAFSIHYFNENKNRRDVIYLRELMLNRLDENSLMTTLRRAVSQFNYATVKFTNLVAPDQEIYELLKDSEIVKRVHLCFYHYLSEFVAKLLALPDYTSGIEQLRMFVDSVKENADYYSKFRRLQLTKSGDLDLPTVEYSSWDSVTSFLTRCLSLHDTFVDFVDRFNVPNYITHEVFLDLTGLYRILVQCVKSAKSFGLTSSISQIMPTIYGLHRCIQDLNVEPPISHEIQSAFTRTFSPLTRSSDRYDVASLLDPRYAYKETVYGSQQWSHIEKKLISEFLDMQVGHQNEQKIQSILATAGKQERTHILQKELKTYRQIILGQRPEEYSNPFVWWISRSETLDILPVFARDYLACPAAVVDADFHFGAGGKFSHLCKIYSHKYLENVLNAAGVHQRFEGRGANSSFPAPNQLEQINMTANRRRKEVNLQRMSRKRMMPTDEYYSPSNFAKKPVIDSSDEQKPINDLHLTLHEAKQEPEEEMESYSLANYSSPDPERNSSVPQEEHISTIHTKEDQESSSAEQKPDASSLLDVKKEIKDEPLSEDDYEELTEQVSSVQMPPAKRIIVTSANRPAGIVRTLNGKIVHVQSVVRAPPTTTAIMFPSNRPNPQVVQKANFVQKFAQKQNFVQKFTPRNPEAVASRQQQFNRPDWTNGVKISFEEGKPENVNFDSMEGITDDPENSYNAVLNRIEGNRYYVHKTRKPCNRRCAVCSSMEEHENLKNVTIDNEKLMIVLGATYRNEMTIAEAANCVAKPTKTYMCRVHFSEACDEIFKMLRVKHPDEIATCSSDLINNSLITVSQIRQRKMTVPELRQLLVHFATKYWEAQPSGQPTSQLDEDSFQDDEIEEGDILPKTHRQPRKQVLEEDQLEATVKLIEQEDFKLPKMKPADDTTSTNFEQPEFCRYCSEHNTRTDMVRVPKGEDKVIRWLHALGQEFGRRLKPEGENYICRSHFDKDSFSSRGRLLKGMLPNVKPDKVSITYKIDGDNFLKLGEERSGREKDATFDLENGHAIEEEDFSGREESNEDIHENIGNLYEHEEEDSPRTPEDNTTPSGEEVFEEKYNPACDLMNGGDNVVKGSSIQRDESSSAGHHNSNDKPSSSQTADKKRSSRISASPVRNKKTVPPPSRVSARLSKKF